MQIYFFIGEEDEDGLPPFHADAAPRVGENVRLQNLNDNKYTTYRVKSVMWSYLYDSYKTSESTVYIVLDGVEA